MLTNVRAVAFARILIGLAAIGTTLEGHAHLLRIADGKLAVPVTGWFPGPADLPLAAMLAAGMLAGLGLMVGSCTSSSAATIAGLQVVMLLSDQQLYSSHRLLLTLLCCHLVFARSDAAWSLRARYRGGRDAVPVWPQLLMIGAVSSLYLFAGISKINSVFLSGHVLQAQMTLDLPGGFYDLLAYATVATEVFLGVGLWFARTRLIAVVVGVALHVSIVVTLGHWFPLATFALMCVAVYPMILTRPTGSVVGLGVVPHQRYADH